MIIQSLPSYSSERYYLLSEIEQKSRLFFKDDMNNEKMDVPLLDSPMVVLYAKWSPLINDEIFLFEKFSQILTNIRIEDAPSTYIIIDAYINDQLDWTCGTLNPLMETVIGGLIERTGISNIVIGITDNPAGLPGLEKCYDLLERISPGYQSFSLVCDLVTIDRVEMMGHDPSLEPDAKSGIFQVLCTSQDASAEESTLDRILNRCKVQCSSPTQRESNPTRITPTEQVIYLIALLLVMYYISLYIKT